MSAAAKGTNRYVVLTFLAVFLPPAFDLLTHDVSHYFDWLTSDSYYFLVIARNASRGSGLSFDGEHLTNGFHPLWQLLLVVMFLYGRAFAASPLAMLIVDVWFSLGVVAFGAALLAQQLIRLRPGIGWLCPLLPMGLYGFVLLPLWAKGHATDPTMLYGTFWASANGMEASLVLVCFALCLRCLVDWRDSPSVTATRRLGLSTALLILARLDLGLFLLPAMVGLLLEFWRQRPRKNLLALAAWTVTPLAICVAYNSVVFGHPLPLSGLHKSSFPYWNSFNLARVYACLTAPWQQGYHRHYRVLQHFLPALLGLLFALRYAYRRSRQQVVAVYDSLFAQLGIGAVLLGVYNLGFVDLPYHGAWYAPVQTTLCSIWAMLVLPRLAWPRAPLAASVVIFVVSLAAGHLTRPGRWAERYASFYFDDAPKLVAFYRGQRPKFVELDDGIFAYATGFQTLNGMGLAIDAEAHSALQRGRFLELAVARGYDRVTNVTYRGFGWLRDKRTQEDLWTAIKGHATSDDKKRFHYSLEYLDRQTGVIRLRPLRKPAKSSLRPHP